jgi:hypothetical protein
MNPFYEIALTLYPERMDIEKLKKFVPRFLTGAEFKQITGEDYTVEAPINNN